jgi:hypothetical protein
MIYIEEAHATDEWNIGASAGVIVESHKSITDRMNCIDMFVKNNNVTFPVYPDDMKSSFMNTFASWPVRCFITKNNVFHHISKPINGEVDFCELFEIALKLCDD